MLRLAPVALCLAACAGRAEPSEPPPVPDAEVFFNPPRTPGGAALTGAMIGGVVTAVETHERIEGALVILQCDCLQGQREVMTDARGIYRFTHLPPGKFTVQVLAGQANVNKSLDVPADASSRANFSVDRELKWHISCSFPVTPRRFTSGHAWVLMGNLDLPLEPPRR